MIPNIDMTSKAPLWEPSETIFTEQEDAMTNFRGGVITGVISSETIARGRQIINSLSANKYDTVDCTDDKIFFNALKVKVNVDKVGDSKRRCCVTSESLSHKWLILQEVGSKTV